MNDRIPKQEHFCWQSPEGTIYQCGDDEVIPGSIPMYLVADPSWQKPWVGLTTDELTPELSGERSESARMNC